MLILLYNSDVQLILVSETELCYFQNNSIRKINEIIKVGEDGVVMTK